MQEIRLGSIGSGMIAHKILHCAVQTQGVILEAVYSRSEKTGAELAWELGAPKVYTDLQQMLADPEINTVYIASPNSLHYSQTKQALLAGKHVVCEKPFCPRLREARELVELAKERGLLLVDAVPMSYLPNLELLRQQLPKIGRVRLVQCNYSQYSSRYDLLLQGALPNIFNPDFAGGCLMDLNFYNVYLNGVLFGAPDSVTYYPNFYPKAADTSGILVLQYGDFVSECTAAKDTWGRNFVQIEGEKGYIYGENSSSELTALHVVTKEGEQLLNAQQGHDHWSYEVQRVAEILLQEDREAVEARQQIMLTVMEILEKARKKAGIFFPGD